jgi:prolyl-tRNA synthetase
MLGQNFAKAFDVSFLNEKGDTEYVWQTSWGVSTRLIGALIMAHSDDKGLVLPPNLAPISAVIVPIGQGTPDYDQVFKFAKELSEKIGKETGLNINFDDRDSRPGEKFFYWEKKGVPVRIEIGPKDLKNNSVVFVRRDTGEKINVPTQDVIIKIQDILIDIQNSLYEKAKKFRDDNTKQLDNWTEFKQTIEEKGGFIYAHWCGDADCEAKIKEETGATIRCIPFDQKTEEGKCVCCDKQSNGLVVFAKSY